MLQRINYYGSVDAYISGNTLAYFGLIAFVLGGLFLKLGPDHMKPGSEGYWSQTNIGFYKTLGICLIIISFPFWAITLAYSRMVITTAGSYTALADAALPGYITSLGKFIYVGFFALIFYFNKSQKKVSEKICILILIIMLSSVMILGSRSEVMTILFAFLIFYFRCTDYKLNAKKVVGYVIAIYVLLNLLYAIQISRNYGFNLSNIATIFFHGGIDAILNEISEFGFSSFTTMVVHSRIHEFHPLWFLLKELGSLAPIPIQGDFSVVASVKVGAAELGTTYIGEMYYYFGNFFWIGCIGISWYIIAIENWLETKLYEQNYYVFLMFSMWMWQEINCIRASYNLAIKTIIYSFVLFEIVRAAYNSFIRVRD